MSSLQTRTATNANGGNMPVMLKEVKTDTTPSALPSSATIAWCGILAQVAIEEVSPEQAEKYLQNMAPNRRISRRQIDVLQKEMSVSWIFNGEPLIFDEAGMMVDGQHRCVSSVRSKRSFVSLTVRGVSREAFDRIDGGKKRSGGDILSAMGVKYDTLVSAAVSRLVNYSRTGNWYHAEQNFSAHDVAMNYPRFPGLVDCARLGQEIARSTAGMPTNWTTFIWLCRERDPNLARQFFSNIVSGANMVPGDPELALSRQLTDIRLNGKIHLTDKQFAALATNAWNNKRRGRKVKAIRGLVGDADVQSLI